MASAEVLWKRGLMPLALAAILTGCASAFGLTLRMRGVRVRFPWVTLVVGAATAAVSAAGELQGPVLDLLRRDGPALAQGEWWRTLSPLLVQDGGWAGGAANIAALLVIGVLVESLLSRPQWLAGYIGAGVVSEAAAYTAFRHQGFAGNSVAVFGLVGMASVVVLIHGAGAPRIMAAVSIAAGLALLLVGDLHGVGMTAGSALGAGVGALQRRRHSRVAGAPESPNPRRSTEGK